MQNHYNEIIIMYECFLVRLIRSLTCDFGNSTWDKDGVLFHQVFQLAFCQGDAYSNGGSSCSGQDYHFVQADIGRDWDHPSYHWYSFAILLTLFYYIMCCLFVVIGSWILQILLLLRILQVTPIFIIIN